MKKHRRQVLFSGIITAIGTHTTTMYKWYKFMFSINFSRNVSVYLNSMVKLVECLGKYMERCS